MNVAWTKIVLLAAGRTMNRILMGEKCAILCFALEQNRTEPQTLSAELL